MNLNTSIFEKVSQANGKVLVVTKYWDKEKTKTLIKKCEQEYGPIVFGFGENRIQALAEKDLPREKVHYIGNLQSKKLSKIAKYCSVIHSLDSINHAEKLDKVGLSLGIFIQIKLDKNKPNGIEPEELKNFSEKMKKFKNLEVLGISGMGKLSVDNKQLTENSNKKEFQLLVDLRNKYLPKKSISAGTSQDYEMALEEGIDVVRVGGGVIL